MVGQACQGLDSSIDFSLYDNDGDGECDVVIVLYAGDGEASSYDDDAKTLYGRVSGNFRRRTSAGF